MTSIAFDLGPLAVHMIQRVTHSTPPVTITAPAPEHHCITYDVLSESNRQSYVIQSAATRDGKVAEFRRR
jgi:hypothetical protein